jgi:hypothetical protein
MSVEGNVWSRGSSAWRRLVDTATITWDFSANGEAKANAVGSAPPADSVTNTELANMAEATVKGRQAGAGTGDPQDLTASQLIDVIETADGAGSGLDADLLDGQSSAFYATASSLSDHLADGSDAHDASAISYLGATGLSATDVEGALDELDSEKVPKTTTVTAGDGLTGGGDLSANRTVAVGASTSIIVGADDVQRAALTGAVAASQNSNATTMGGGISIVIDGGGSEITTGIKGDVRIPFACTVTGWTLLADQTGAIVIDVWRDTLANFPPTDADSITNGSEPEIAASGTNAEDTNLGDWTDVTLDAGDILRFNVDSVTDITRVTLLLHITKTG